MLVVSVLFIVVSVSKLNLLRYSSITCALRQIILTFYVILFNNRFLCLRRLKIASVILVLGVSVIGVFFLIPQHRGRIRIVFDRRYVFYITHNHLNQMDSKSVRRNWHIPRRLKVNSLFEKAIIIGNLSNAWGYS